MKIDMGQPKPAAPSGGQPQEGRAFIDWNNMKRTSERLDQDGNVIDPRTKQVIKKNDDASA